MQTRILPFLLGCLLVFSLLITACGGASAEGGLTLDLGSGDGGESSGVNSQGTILLLLIVLVVVATFGILS